MAKRLKDLPEPQRKLVEELLEGIPAEDQQGPTSMLTLAMLTTLLKRIKELESNARKL